MDEITASNVKKAVELDHKHDDDLTMPEKIANKANDFAGSVAFIICHLVVFTLWIGYNLFAGKSGFDPYPFTFLTMTVSLEAIILSSLLLISQNRMADKSDARHKLDLQINLLAEQENTMMLRVLDRIAEKLGTDSKELEEYLEDVRPEEVSDAIEKEENSTIKGARDA